MNRIAVVILNYNGVRLLETFLPSVLRHSPEADIVVADNGSGDGSVAFIQKLYPHVRVIQLDQNHGYCGGYNRALEVVKNEWVVLLNSDVEVSPGWLPPLMELFDQDPLIAAIQPKILSYHDKRFFEYAGAGGGMMDALGYPYCRGRVLGRVEEDRGQYNDTVPIFWASGACLAIRREVFWELGGLDEDFFAHMEEIDLCWKAKRKGLKVYYCGKSVVYHAGAGTLAYQSPGKTFLNFRNALFLIFRHLAPGELWVKLPLRLALDMVAASMFFIQGKPGNAWAVLRAQAAFFSAWKREWRKRRGIRSQHLSISPKTGYGGLIFFKYLSGGQ